MESIKGFNFQAIHSDRKGAVSSGIEELATHVKEHRVTDVILLCHGFRNDENDARGLYTRFLTTFADNRSRADMAARLAGRTFAVGGMFWPSMVFPEPNDSQGVALSVAGADDRARLEAMKTAVDASGAARIDAMIAQLPSAAGDESAQLQMAASLLALVDDLPEDDGNEIRTALANATPDSLRDALLAGEALDVVQPGSGGGGAGMPQLGDDLGDTGAGASLLGRVFGFVPRFVNLATFLLMFNRCGEIGEKGLSRAVRRVKELSNPRVHLVGHSLGARAVTACARALLQAPAQTVDTMLLLQAAFSHFGLSPAGTTRDGIRHPRGHFRDVIEKKVVKGPILATYSTHDSTVGFAYTAMAAVSLNNARAIGDEKSPFGGIGRNGVLDTKEATQLELNLVGAPYTFAAGAIHNLNGSRVVDGKALIGSHGDVASPAITWAFSSLVASV